MTVFFLILSLILFIGLVVAHEWGHFIVARRGGVEVEEFGIGFPPKVWAKKVKTSGSKFLFSINLLPLGGFVRLKGEHDADTRPGSYGAAPLKTKVKIMLAGVTMNLIIAYLMLTVLAATALPKLIDNQFTVAGDTRVIQQIKDKDVVKVDTVVGSTPAEKAGIKHDDRILAINGQKITSPEEVSDATKDNAGKTVPIRLERSGKEITVRTTLNKQNEGEGYLGISTISGQNGIELRRSTWSAPVVAAGLIGQFTQLTFKGLGTAIADLSHGQAHKASEQVSGPVGIFYILKEGGKLGLSFIMTIIAVISLTLAIINVLPIPALDGGRLFITLLFKAIKKPLTKTREEFIHGAGFAFLMILFVLITFVDIRRFF
ncbi:MAG TPA: M50 family metallopeptidase [Candidatus Saccharimonadales bacterium]|nr:M50 family metallopeptidase [Candidatus Saccharimonadales bacterium]